MGELKIDFLTVTTEKILVVILLTRNMARVVHYIKSSFIRKLQIPNTDFEIQD